ncbi:hypothetical protein G6F57_022910 [Rhizopus arrhizus]|nr:hypothetical protein G6F57_022910 [Rhizopus arrhizus]
MHGHVRAAEPPRGQRENHRDQHCDELLHAAQTAASEAASGEWRVMWLRTPGPARRTGSQRTGRVPPDPCPAWTAGAGQSWWRRPASATSPSCGAGGRR